jgi:hypothetical protein
MSSRRHINVAKEYSAEPAGRYPSDGPFNGQRFRQEFLVVNLNEGTDLEIDFDGTEGYGSSFLEEAFGGLVRHGISASELHERLKILSKEDPSVIEEIWQYIDQASAKK